MLFEIVEKRTVLDQRRLDCLGHASTPMSIGKCVEKGRIVDDGEWGSERAEIVLLAEGVDAVLDAHCRIVLREHRRRYPDQPDTAVRGRCRISSGVEDGAAADCDDVGMTA